MYSNKILNFQESTSILNACTKKVWNLLKAPRIYIYLKEPGTTNPGFTKQIIRTRESWPKRHDNIKVATRKNDISIKKRFCPT